MLLTNSFGETPPMLAVAVACWPLALVTSASVPSLPSPAILQDFDTIQKMGATANAGPDRELLRLMK